LRRNQTAALAPEVLKPRNNQEKDTERESAADLIIICLFEAEGESAYDSVAC
jgi:hypothetical protein